MNPVPPTKKVPTVGSLCSMWCGQQMWVLEVLQHVIASGEARLSSRPIHDSARGDRTQRLRASSWMLLGICSQRGNKLYIKGWFKLGFQSILKFDLQKNYIHRFFVIYICYMKTFVSGSSLTFTNEHGINVERWVTFSIILAERSKINMILINNQLAVFISFLFFISF